MLEAKVGSKLTKNKELSAILQVRGFEADKNLRKSEFSGLYKQEDKYDSDLHHQVTSTDPFNILISNLKSSQKDSDYLRAFLDFKAVATAVKCEYKDDLSKAIRSKLNNIDRLGLYPLLKMYEGSSLSSNHRNAKHHCIQEY